MYAVSIYTICVRLFLNCMQDLGRTALMEACSRGHTDIVQMLLNNHADPNIRNNVGSYIQAKFYNYNLIPYSMAGQHCFMHVLEDMYKQLKFF